jgi:branched-chain amino acid transport system substrate-binding protein
MGGLIGAVALVGCTALTPFEDECNSDTDCTGGLECVENLCVAGSGEGGPGGAGGAGGMGGAGGIGAGGMGGVAGMGGMTGEPVLDPDLCHTLYGADSVADALSDDVVTLGMLMPTTGQLGALGESIVRGAVLALDEINQAGGVDGRRLALVVCDTAVDEEQAIAGAEWLIENFNVPAIIGPAASSVTIRVFNDVGRPNGVLMISPSATAPSISTVPDPADLLWRTAPSDALQGAAMAAYLLDQDFQKVALVNRDDAYGNGFVDRIRGPLRDAGRAGEANLFNRRYPAMGATAQDYVGILGDLQDFEPDVVVLIAFLEDAIEFLTLAAELDFDRFILTDGARNTQIIDDVMNPQIVDGIIGTAPASPAGQVFEDFVFDYTAKFGADPDVFNAQCYDAMYLLGYAVAGSNGAPLTGPGISEQLKRLSSGDIVNPGGETWNANAALLAGNADATINYEGASGPLDFDPIGEAATDVEGWRLDRGAGRVRSLGIIYTADGQYRGVPDEGGAGGSAGGGGNEPDMGAGGMGGG